MFSASDDAAKPVDPATIAKLEALKEGDMKKLVLHSTAKPAGSAAYDTIEGTKATLADHAGRIVLLNFWATWCAPCRKEMPMLAELQSELGGDDFEVITIATGRNEPAAMARFFKEIGVTNLPLHRDPTSALGREMGVLGLPATIILNRDGDEIARLLGDAHWSSDSAKAILQELISTGQ
ncbi:TlpA family protein disulfide reductase [Lentibacter algarum]|uniref:TlpA disulfide reductase family protein n=1 Tax=Lentibacter algarum TaxID=576131 RepID=UPI001C0A07BE|nr:TlpA disulfide reductase family protein [Lentibacter algarum]MBU2983579.1 TlpA family protein disulfide reductase [Lentibacter algarum]